MVPPHRPAGESMSPPVLEVPVKESKASSSPGADALGSGSGTQEESSLTPLSPISTRPFEDVYESAHPSPRGDISEWRRRLNSMFFWWMSEPAEETKEDSAIKKAASEKIATILSNHPESVGPQRRAVHRILKTLWNAFATGDHVELNDLHEDTAQIALDIMQEIFSQLHESEQEDDPIIRKQVRRLLLRRLQKLSCEALLLPSQITVQNLECTDFRTYGSGGFADVYRGALGGSPVAIKHLRTFKGANPSEVKKFFYREAILWSNLEHRHILRFRGISEGSSRLPGLCMVLQWAEKKDLSHYLDTLVQEGLSGHQYVVKVNRWLYGIAQGLEYLHDNGIAHGDLRGVNVLVGGDGTVFLGDFGLSVISDVGNSFTEANEAKPCAWIAPELLEPTKVPRRPTSASDMFSFGRVCVELYSNAPPFGNLGEYETIRMVVAKKYPKRPQLPGRELSEALWSFVTSCWKSPAKRPSAADAVRTLYGLMPPP